MKIHIFGSQKFPDISFKNNPRTGLTISTKNAGILNYEGLNEITWKDFLERGSSNLIKRVPLDKSRKVFWGILKEELIKLTETKAEKYFFEGYLEICETDLYTGERLPLDKIMPMPALIPQVWINWLHYDKGDKERAEQVRKLPQRVDFLMYYKKRWVIIELDGSSHFSEIIDIDPSGKIRLEGSMEKYTQHLRKDRWLRQQGYEVWRFSDLEIDEIEKEVKFFEKFGDWPSEKNIGGIPWPNKSGYINELFVNMGINLPVEME